MMLSFPLAPSAGPLLIHPPLHSRRGLTHGRLILAPAPALDFIALPQTLRELLQRQVEGINAREEMLDAAVVDVGENVLNFLVLRAAYVP
jgi:hypothetical protein